jgi:hypothetical protein
MSTRQAASFILVFPILAASFSETCMAQGFTHQAAIQPETVKLSNAQHGDAQPHWTDSTTTKVKPELRQEFEGYLKRLIAANKKAGTLWFLTFETFAGDTTEYTTVVPVIRFGDLDGPSAVVHALGVTEWNRLSRDIARCYTAQTRRYATPHKELEIDKAHSPAGVYWVETSTLVVPGKLGDYLNWLANDYRPALEKAGVLRFQVSQPIFGAPSGEIVISRMLQNLGDIDEGAVLSKALSEEDARAVAEKSVPLVRSSNTKILRMRTDLSYTESK